MKFNNSAILIYVETNSTIDTRRKVNDSQVERIDFFESHLEAKVLGTKKYTVKVFYDSKHILKSSCSCPYSYSGICKHIINVLFKADEKIIFPITQQNSTEGQIMILNQEKKTKLEIMKDLAQNSEIEEIPFDDFPKKFNATSPNLKLPQPTLFVFENFSFDELNDELIETFSAEKPQDIIRRYSCDSYDLEINHGTFYNITSHWDTTKVKVDYFPENETLNLDCNCKNIKRKMCKHITSFLYILLKNDDIGFYFIPRIRNEKFKVQAKAYGLENLENLDDYFTIEKKYGSVYVVPKKK